MQPTVFPHFHRVLARQRRQMQSDVAFWSLVAVGVVAMFLAL